MKKQLATAISLLTLSFSYAQWTTGTPFNIAQQVTNGAVGIGVNPPTVGTKLEIRSTSNQLKLSNTSSIFSDITTNSSGHLLFTTTGNKVGFGPTPSLAVNGFHSNLGRFLITDNASLATRGIIFQPHQTAGGDMPAGSSITSAITTSGEGFALVPCAYGYAGVKMGAYAFAGNGFGGGVWKSIWETANTTAGNPDLLLVKNGGNVGIGTGATASTAKLEVAGQVKITGGTPGANKVLTSDATGLASWQPVNGLLSGGTQNYVVKWANATTLSSTSLIYDNGTNVGIGTSNPREKLEVNGNARIGADGVSEPTVDPNTALTIYQSGANKKGLKFKTWDNSLPIISIENVNFTSSPFTVYGSGKTAIGIKKPSLTGPHSDAMLSVDGKMVAKEIIVSTSNWADYVFAKGYHLPNLSDIENYYLANNHLPEVPSEKEVKENGINVADMNVILLKKIEELTILMVEQEKRIKQLESRK